MMTILYPVYHNLYVNLTNRCPCSCTFCLRNKMDNIENSDPLWLDHEPTIDEIKAESLKFDMDAYEEVVICGFGEPTEALDVLLETAKYFKETYKKPIRLNTNGLGNRIHNEDIAPKFQGLIDTISISLNTPNEEEYQAIVRPIYKDGALQSVIDFAKSCTHYIPNVILTTVETTITKEQEKECAKICADIGATYRIREWID